MEGSDGGSRAQDLLGEDVPRGIIAPVSEVIIVLTPPLWNRLLLLLLNYPLN